jgi:1,4-dihydroxy-2-naphthoyl-CoA hydrolase
VDVPPAELPQLLAAIPFAAGLGVVLDAASEQEVVGRLPWAPERCTVGGVLHGGALITLADTVGAVCAFLGLPPGASTATTSSTTYLLRAVRDGQVVATARPVHRGRSSVVVRTDLVDEQHRPVAQVTQSQAVLPPPAAQ